MVVARLFGSIEIDIGTVTLGARDFGGIKPKQVLEILLAERGRAVAKGEKASPDFSDGLAAQRLLEAASRSAREGRRVTIAEIVADGG